MPETHIYHPAVDELNAFAKAWCHEDGFVLHRGDVNMDNFMILLSISNACYMGV
jgi:hypothetical protein